MRASSIARAWDCRSDKARGNQTVTSSAWILSLSKRHFKGFIHVEQTGSESTKTNDSPQLTPLAETYQYLLSGLLQGKQQRFWDALFMAAASVGSALWPSNQSSHTLTWKEYKNEYILPAVLLFQNPASHNYSTLHLMFFEISAWAKSPHVWIGRSSASKSLSKGHLFQADILYVFHLSKFYLLYLYIWVPVYKYIYIMNTVYKEKYRSRSNILLPSSDLLSWMPILFGEGKKGTLGVSLLPPRSQSSSRVPGFGESLTPGPWDKQTPWTLTCLMLLSGCGRPNGMLKAHFLMHRASIVACATKITGFRVLASTPSLITNHSSQIIR